MLFRAAPLPCLVGLVGASLALSTLACSSLTRPDEIRIVAEPPPTAAPAPAGTAAGAPANHGAQAQAAPSGG